MAGPLEGIRVIDATQMISGPMAAGLLGDQGADVIKIEPPGIGDPVRYFGAMRGGMSALFATCNRNKRSVVLDVKQPDDLERIHALVETADVFMQNFRTGAADRIGLGEEVLRVQRPDLVYVSISGFGERGPYADRRVYDPVIQALSGMAAIQGAGEAPHMVRTILPDKLTAMMAAQAICAALFARERSGKGEHVRLAMLDAMVAWLWPDGMWNHTFLGDGVVNELPGGFNLVFETADGHITTGALTDPEWAGLSRALGHPEWSEDPRFLTIPDRVGHIEEFLEVIADVIRTQPTAAWLRKLEAEQVPCAPILDIDAVIAEPQVAANELLEESEHPTAGRMRSPRPAARFERTDTTDRRPAPTLGEHTGDVLAELAARNGRSGST